MEVRRRDVKHLAIQTRGHSGSALGAEGLATHTNPYAGQKPATPRQFVAPRSVRHSLLRSIIHAHHEDRFHLSISHGEGDSHKKSPVAESGSQRMPLDGGLAATPDGAGIPKGFEPAIAVVHGIVSHAIAARR